MLSGIGRAVFIGCHTDDEMVAAGTLHRLARSGVEVHVVTVAPAAVESDRTGGVESEKAVIPEWHRALELIGVHEDCRRFLGLTPSADLYPHRQRICQYVYDFCERFKPDVALVLSPHDENTAHAIVGVECERVMRGRVPQVWRCAFPWNYGHGDRPNLYVRLDTEDLGAKRAVIGAYRSQAFRYKYAEMLMAYVVGDGLSVKVPAAEKFELVRGVV